MKFSQFKENIAFGNFYHAYIFEGDSDFLSSSSSFFVESILNPKGNSRYEVELKEGTHPDLLIVEPEKNHISISTIRNIIDYVQVKPIYAEYKVVIINSAQQMGIEASNALLKTLEEPFDYVIICLLVNNKSRLLDTIQSRCIAISQDNYTEKFDYSNYDKLIEVFELAMGGDFMAIYSSKNREYLMSLKDDENFLNILYNLFKELYFYINTGSVRVDKKMSNIFEKHRDYSIDKIENILNLIEEVKRNLKNNVNFQLSIEKIFVEILKKET